MSRYLGMKRALCLALAGCISGCAPVSLGFLDPAGPVASGQRELFLWVVGLALIVVLPVLVITPWLLWRYRYGQDAAPYRPRWEYSLPMEILTWGVPVLVVVALGVLTWQRSHSLDPYRPLPGNTQALDIQVIAMDWKWLFIYPQQGVASLNELVIPSGRPVHLTLTSATVMQALLIPRLSGQIYAMAGMRTQQYLQADAVGSFSGHNTQFNGDGFQKQAFGVRSLPPEQFAAWLDGARHSAQPLDCQRYLGLAQHPSTLAAQRYREAAPGLFMAVLDAAREAALPSCPLPAKDLPHE